MLARPFTIRAILKSAFVSGKGFLILILLLDRQAVETIYVFSMTRILQHSDSKQARFCYFFRKCRWLLTLEEISVVEFRMNQLQRANQMNIRQLSLRNLKTR